MAQPISNGRCGRGPCCTARLPILFCLCYSIYSMIFPYLYSSSTSIGTQYKIGSGVFWWLVTGESIVYGLAAVVAGYFGGKSQKKAKWVAGGFTLIAGGCCLLALTAFIAPLPEVKNEESEMWKGIYMPATKEDISTPLKLLDSYWGKKFPTDVRQHLNATGHQMLEANEQENKTKRAVKLEEMEKGFSNTLDVMRRDLLFGMQYVEATSKQAESSEPHRLFKRQMPDFEFPDATRDRLKAGFEVAVMGMIWFGDSYEHFAQQVYNLTNDPEIFDRIMKSARLPFAYCRNTSMLVRDRLQSIACIETLPSLTLIALILACLATGMLGVGAATVATVGTAYMEEVVEWKTMPKLLAALATSSYVLAFIGAGLGFVCDVLLYSRVTAPPPLNPLDPRWVGAWWIGLLAIFVLIKFPTLAIWRYAYGASMSQNITINPNGVDHNISNGVEQKQATDAAIEANGVKNTCGNRRVLDPKHIERLFDALVEVMRQPVYTALLFALTFHAMAISGYFMFMPKYMENNLSLSKATNGTVIGLAGLIYACLGSWLGSILVWKTKYSGKTLAKYLFIAAFAIFAFSLVQKWLACNSVVNQIQDIGMKNPANRPYWPSCQGCICDSAGLYPVCANDSMKTPFYSPCHAGCTNFTYKVEEATVKFTFDYCACAETPRTLVAKHFCQDDCTGVYVGFSALFLLTCLASGILIVPSVLIVLRTATHNHRSLALGVLAFCICIFGLLPSSLLYRFVTDSSCLVWKSTCGNGRGHCEMYETNTFRDRFHGFAAFLNLVAYLFFGLVLYHSKQLNLAKQTIEIPAVEIIAAPKEEESQCTDLGSGEEQNGDSVQNGGEAHQQTNTFIGKL